MPGTIVNDNITVQLPGILVNDNITLQMPGTIVNDNITLQMPGTSVNDNITLQMPGTIVNDNITVQMPGTIVNDNITLQMPGTIVNDNITVQMPGTIVNDNITLQMPSTTQYFEGHNVLRNCFTNLQTSASKMRNANVHACTLRCMSSGCLANEAFSDTTRTWSYARCPRCTAVLWRDLRTRHYGVLRCVNIPHLALKLTKSNTTITLLCTLIILIYDSR